MNGMWFGMSPRPCVKKKWITCLNVIIILGSIDDILGVGVYDNLTSTRNVDLILDKIIIRAPKVTGKWLQPQSFGFANHNLILR